MAIEISVRPVLKFWRPVDLLETGSFVKSNVVNTSIIDEHNIDSPNVFGGMNQNTDNRLQMEVIQSNQKRAFTESH